MASDLIKLTTSIVTSHLSSTKMPSEELLSFVERVFNTLEKLDKNYVNDFGVRSTGGAAPSETRTEIPVAKPAPVAPAASAAPARAARSPSKTAAAPEKPRRPVGRPRKDAAAQPELTMTGPAAASEAGRKTFRPSPKSTRDFKDGVDPDRWPGVFEDKIVCLEDNVETTLLRAYVKNRYGLSLEQYKEKWSLPADYPYAPPQYRERKRAIAQQSGLGTKLRPKSQQAAIPAPTARRKPGTLSPAWAK